MRDRGRAPLAILALLAAVACSSHPEKSVVDSYFNAVNARDNQTLSSFAAVNFDKKVQRWTIKKTVEESTRTVVSRDGWKLCLRDKDLNELYNLQNDPLETRNLYADRQYASVISHFAGEIHRWQQSTNDKLRL